MNNESDMKRGVSSVSRHYNPSILKETDPREGMDEIALRELVTTLRTRLVEVEADAAVMRVALEQSKSVHKKQFVGPIDADFVEHQNAFEACRAALATDAGKSLLERQKEAEWLLIHSNDLPKPDGWFDRRDTFLNPTNKDVK